MEEINNNVGHLVTFLVDFSNFLKSFYISIINRMSEISHNLGTFRIKVSAFHQGHGPFCVEIFMIKD